jgi:hypothetical protein
VWAQKRRLGSLLVSLHCLCSIASWMATSEFTLRFTRQDGKIDMFRWKFASFFKNPGVPLSALMLHEMLPPCRSRDSIWLEFHAGLDHYADRQEGGAWVCDWTACRKTTSHTEYNQHTHTPQNLSKSTLLLNGFPEGHEVVVYYVIYVCIRVCIYICIYTHVQKSLIVSFFGIGI